MTTVDDLPKPEKNKGLRSQALTTYLREQIAKHQGKLSFADFMATALYHPELGYYNADTFTLGKAGDFTTAPEISPLFARVFAQQSLAIFSQLGTADTLEIGAGTGRFAKDFLSALNQLHALPQHYFIYETSLKLRKKQQDFLRTQAPEFYSRITWLDAMPQGFKGTIIANEVLDALPFHCFSIEKNSVKERCITWENAQFAWQICQPTLPELTEKAEQRREQYGLFAGYASEINLALPAFLQSITQALTQGVMLFIDYGYGQREYYHPLRKEGTLTCFYQHLKHENPLILPGLQDITAHVDFTYLIETAAENECTLLGYTTQAAFLLANGLTEWVAQEEKKLNAAQVFQLHQAIKLLTLPTEMGERIKVMALAKGVEFELSGFALQDRRRDL